MKINQVSHPRHHPENVNSKHQASLGLQDKIAVGITAAIGTMYAVYLFAIIMAGWMFWQLRSGVPFDPYPFAFLLFLGNIIQLLLMPLIMVGQNIQGRHTELRSDEEYKTTLSSYHDIEAIREELKQQSEMLEKLLEKR